MPPRKLRSVSPASDPAATLPASVLPTSGHAPSVAIPSAPATSSTVAAAAANAPTVGTQLSLSHEDLVRVINEVLEARSQAPSRASSASRVSRSSRPSGRSVDANAPHAVRDAPATRPTAFRPVVPAALPKRAPAPVEVDSDLDVDESSGDDQEGTTRFRNPASTVPPELQEPVCTGPNGAFYPLRTGVAYLQGLSTSAFGPRYSGVARNLRRAGEATAGLIAGQARETVAISITEALCAVAFVLQGLALHKSASAGVAEAFGRLVDAGQAHHPLAKHMASIFKLAEQQVGEPAAVSSSAPKVPKPAASGAPRQPPSPCSRCQGNHWNKDCPQRRTAATPLNTAAASLTQ